MPKTASALRREKSRARKQDRRLKLAVPLSLHSNIMAEIFAALREAGMKMLDLYGHIKAKLAELAEVRDHWVSTVLDEMSGKRYITIRRSETIALTPAGRARLAHMMVA